MKMTLILLFLLFLTILVVCSARNNLRYSLRVIGRTPNSIKLQFPDSRGGVLMYVVTSSARTQDPPWEVLVILPGNDVVSLTNLKTSTSYTLRWRTDTKVFSDVKVSTMDRLNFEIVANKTSPSLASSTSSFETTISTRNVLTNTKAESFATNQKKLRKCFELILYFNLFPSSIF